MEPNTGFFSLVADALKNGKFEWGLPPDISVHGAGIDHMIRLLHVFMVALFVGWGIYLIYCLIRFRARPGHKAEVAHKHFRLPTYLEGGIVLFEIFLLVFLSSPIWFRYKNEPPPRESAIVIKLTAEQFAWNFHYAGKDGVFGPRKVELIEGTNPVGVDRNDAAGKDDIVSVNNLHIPVNKPVILEITSKDVIHSFSVPSLRVKQDAVPGMTIPIWFVATQTGQVDIACAQLCGNGHYRMRGALIVDSEEDFQKFLKEEHDALGLDSGQVSALPESKGNRS